ncbi:glycosyltransferase [Ramlibacter sp. XY19]|uniref:glycosyltransferase n=1 Tax=Ramlibacter paludis TaxID=2908000 RepID=UPI0023DA0DA5|nr:glycosyltransferase [Ramlibacter paludis]MCG2592027.1 glycosyltransferase [Ramlibacter paludis]
MSTLISMVTPCFNAEKYIVETVESMLSQTALASGRAQLQLIVCDGLSRDATVEKVRQLNDSRIEIVSERDAGMYDALAKGFARVQGSIMGYLNAGDYLHKTAFDVILDIFENDEVQWFTGNYMFYNDRSQPVGGKTVFRFTSQLLMKGLYGRYLPTIQQESTFWRADMLSVVDMKVLAGLRLAGDAYLWRSFGAQAPHHTVRAFISGFRIHEGQLSEGKAKYFDELQSFSQRPNPLDMLRCLFEGVMWLLPPRIQLLFSRNTTWMYDHRLEKWRKPTLKELLARRRIGQS